ncbi:hypothetical protein RHMOL_Rhmol05G0246500 [Rhododendron molle]|uniref:Uncharacterized protein n=1 Tax=Rhododendron molle TaxID=49168 RepID=A0ACC0NV08_RHOML|nr:hypothetical protein RHMOL_Rhmol05G0246500 [Rhododendron molle]
MASQKERSLEQTPTWAVAVVCFVLIAISIVIELLIHLLGKASLYTTRNYHGLLVISLQWLTKRNKKALYEALEKIKSELMLVGFISLLLTVGQEPISKICVSEAIGATWHPCNSKQERTKYSGDDNRRKLLNFVDSGESHRRFLASAEYDNCAKA